MRKLIARVALITAAAAGVVSLTSLGMVAGVATIALSTQAGTSVVSGDAAPAAPAMSAPNFTVTRPASYPDCAPWSNLRFGMVTFTGASTHYVIGCINPASPGSHDSLSGHVAGYLAEAAQPSK